MSFEQWLKTLRLCMSRCVGSVWSFGFLVAGVFKRSGAQRWSSAGGERVFVISPHPDDEAIACSGTIAQHLKARDDVSVVIVTDGRLSRQAASPVEMASIRQREARMAAETLGIEKLIWLGLHEGSWRPADLVGPLAELLQAYAPTIVYAPSRIDFHPEHIAVARALAVALGSTLAPKPRIRIYQVQVPLTRTLANVVVDVAEGLPRSKAALRAYESQVGSTEFVERRRRYSAHSHGSARPVEEFWELSVDQYVLLHDESSIEDTGKFRGLRRFAWIDPLAYVVGYGERRRLQALAAQASSAAR